MSKIQLMSNSGNIHLCSLEAICKMSKTIADMIENSQQNTQHKPIPLQSEAMTDEGLKKIIEWVEYHFDDPPIDEDFDEEKDRRNEELNYWDKEFIDVDNGLLFDIIIGANFLNISGLVEVGAKHFCASIKGKTCEQVRQMYKIENDFTKEEEEAIHQENKWIYSKD